MNGLRRFGFRRTLAAGLAAGLLGIAFLAALVVADYRAEAIADGRPAEQIEAGERRLFGSFGLAALAVIAIAGATAMRASRLAAKEIESVTDSMAQRQALRMRQAEEEKSELRAILDHAAEGIIVLNSEGRIRLINGAARRIFGALPDAAGLLLVELTRSPAIADFLESVSRSPESRTVDLEIAGEETRHVRLTGGQVPDAEGLPARTILVVNDLSDLRRLERLRIDFVANASHELKTPLSAIFGYAETLRDDPELERDTRQKFVETIWRNAERLNELVADLLRLARLESSAGAYRFEPLDVNDLVRKVVALQTPAAEERGVKLLFASRADAIPIVGAAEALTQCITNLVDNGVKFTPSGGWVDVTAEPFGAGARIDVVDTGVGIAPEQLGRVFERFYRADSGRSRDAGGTGLGLAIAKHAAVLHGGRIEVESTVGKGSRFRLILPAEPPTR